MTVIHLKKKDVVKTSVKGISIEFDHEQSVAILDVHWKKLESVNTSRRYGKSQECDSKIWEERHLKLHGFDIYGSLNGKEDHELPLWRLAHFGFEAFGVPLDVVRTRRRDDDEAALGGRGEEEEERNKDDFDWEAVIDEATVEGESGSDDQFYDAQVGEEEPMMKLTTDQRSQASSSAQQKEQDTAGVDPSCPTGRLPEAEFLKFQAEFERKRANRFHDDLEKAKAENARLLALLHQAQTKPHP
ncbi:hypothetical protein Dimus_001362 [Dionaea muscipula]